MRQVILRVGGMHCDGCEGRVRRAVGRLQGVARCAADHRAGEVTVLVDPARIDEAALRACIENAGYEVVL